MTFRVHPPVQKFDSGGNRITGGTFGFFYQGYWNICYVVPNGSFAAPAGIAVDSSGYVYVADSGDSYLQDCCPTYDRVQKFDKSGGFITYFGDSCSYKDFGLGGVAVGPSGKVYVANDYYPVENDIYVFSSSGSLISKWKWSDPGPVGVAVDSFENVYVTDVTDAVKKFNSSGSPLAVWSTASGSLFGIAVDLTGNVYVVAGICNPVSVGNCILKLDSTGTLLTQMGSSGWQDGQFFADPYFNGIAVSSSGEVYVADYGNGRIVKFKPVSPYPSRPTNLTASVASPTQISLAWTDNSNNEMGFDIYRKTGIRGDYSFIARVGANVTSYTDTVSGPAAYYYAVYAFSSAGYSAWSNEAEAKIGPRPDIKANGQDGSITIGSSTPVTLTVGLDATGYENMLADVWIAAYAADIDMWYFLNPSGQWTTQMTTAYQGPLYDVGSLSVYSNTAPPEVYDVYFALDLTPNRIPDDSLYADGVEINVVNTGVATAGFLDVPTTYWSYSQIMNMVNQNIIPDCGGGFFCTGDLITQAAVAEYIIKAKYGTYTNFPYTVTPWFYDVPSTHPQFKYIQRMKDDGITSGCGNGYYCPDSSVTRAQMATLIIKATGELPSPAPYNSYFDDIANDGFAGYINRMKERGISADCGTRLYCPNNPVSKDYIAVFLTSISGGGPVTYSISGTVTDGVSPLSGVTMTLSGAGTGTTTTDVSGNYTFTGLANGTYTVTPSRTGYTFSPTSRTATISGANVTGQNFTGTPSVTTYSISGTVTTGGGGGSSPLAGVAMTLSGAAAGSTTTDSLGNYSFTGLANGSYTVTPTKTGYTFSPVNRSVTVNSANVTAQDFTGTAGAVTFSISGTVRTAALSPIQGVTMTLSGASAGIATTDASGNYTFAGLSNGAYAVTPSLTGYTFSPANRNVTISNADVVGQDFTGTPPAVTYSISGTVRTAGGGGGGGGGSSPLAGVTMTLSGAAPGTTTTDANGNYTFSGLSNGTYTVTPSMTGYTFTPVNRSVTISGANITGQDFTRN